MIKLYQKYLGFLYFKNFFIVFLSLEFFYVGVDLLSNLKKLPVSANLQLLYAALNALLAVNYALPLALVFALILTKVFMIRSNELISLYSSGISRSQVVFPFFVVSMVFTLLFIALNFTSFAKVNEYKRNLLRHNKITSNAENLFVKYEENYIYFSKLNPIKKEAFGIKIFKTNNSALEEVIESTNGKFANNSWTFFDVNIVKIPKEKYLSGKGLTKFHKESINTLQGFKPTIIDSMQKGKIALSIIEAREALSFLGSQGGNVDIIKSNLFTMLFFPFFAPLMSLILFYYFPPIGRFANLALFSSVAIFATLSFWGAIFVLSRLSANSVIAPEIAIILPIVMMGVYAFKLFYKFR